MGEYSTVRSITEEELDLLERNGFKNDCYTSFYTFYTAMSLVSAGYNVTRLEWVKNLDGTEARKFINKHEHFTIKPEDISEQDWIVARF